LGLIKPLATGLGSFDQAVVFLGQAMTVATDPIEHADLLEQAALAARLVSQWDEAEEMLVSAVELRRQAGDRVAVARVTTHLGLVLGNQFKFNESIALVEAAIDEFADLADDPVMVELKVQLARVLPFIPEHERALLILEEVLPIAERRDLVSSIAAAFLAKGNSLFAVGRRREGAAVTRLARETAAEHGLTDTWLRATGNLAAHMAEQDIEESLALYREAADMARRLGHRGNLLTTIGNIGYSAYLSGDWDYGLTEMESIYSDTMSPRDGILVLNNLLVIRATHLAFRADRKRPGVDEMVGRDTVARDDRHRGRYYRIGKR
jgi:tetratricopeptide (TPR) repeat protein